MAVLLDLAPHMVRGGAQVVPSAWAEFVDRANGREPRSYGRKDWD